MIDTICEFGAHKYHIYEVVFEEKRLKELCEMTVYFLSRHVKWYVVDETDFDEELDEEDRLFFRGFLWLEIRSPDFPLPRSFLKLSATLMNGTRNFEDVSYCALVAELLEGAASEPPDARPPDGLSEDDGGYDDVQSIALALPHPLRRVFVGRMAAAKEEELCPI